MGKSITPKYRIEEFKIGFWTVSGCMAWRKEYGKPTVENLRKFRDGYNNTMKPGGANAHLSSRDHFGALRIVRQSDNEVIAFYNPPLFEVIN